MIKDKKRMYFLILALLFIPTVTSCSQPKTSEDKTTGDTIVIPEIEKLAFINPLITSSTYSARLSELIFDGLVQLDEHFDAKPHLARSWERSKDGRVWTFYLRRDVKFHDNVELTAEDVMYTFQKIRESQTRSPFMFIFKEIEDIVVRDKYTIEISLKKPLASFIQILDVGIVPKHLGFQQLSMGTGPFKLKAWSETEIVLEVNEDYFLGRPYLDQIKIVVYPNRQSAWAKLMAGQGDLFHLLSPANYQLLKQVSTFRLYSVPMPFYYLIAVNLEKDIFADQKIRQALNYAVNKDEIVAKALKSQGQVATGTVYPGSWAYSSEVHPYPYDPNKALLLLKGAGWTDHDGDHFLDKDSKPFEFTVHVNAGDELKEKTLLLVQQDLFDIGVKMKVKAFDPNDTEFLFRKEFEAHFPEIFARGDPDFSYKYWHSSQIKEGFNVSSYRNPKVDWFLEEGRTEFDLNKRKAIYDSFQKEILQDPPGIILFWTDYLVGVHQRFKGVRISPVGLFANIREWYVPKAEQKYGGLGKANE